MALAFTCDGNCGENTSRSDEFHERGNSAKAHYCDKCILAVDEYLKQRDDLHTQIAKMWSDSLMVLQQRFRPLGGRLPDE